ncbi:MAG TPA: hypothetical protein PKD03_10775 [Ignavibacteriaceae bacterium]|nr:hypothetical protein [Ignavibacteriaceae bacterium]
MARYCFKYQRKQTAKSICFSYQRSSIKVVLNYEKELNNPLKPYSVFIHFQQLGRIAELPQKANPYKVFAF